jgi:hypothetical protein
VRELVREHGGERGVADQLALEVDRAPGHERAGGRRVDDVDRPRGGHRFRQQRERLVDPLPFARRGLARADPPALEPAARRAEEGERRPRERRVRDPEREPLDRRVGRDPRQESDEQPQEG